jgi:hypothetical protein
LSIQSATSAPGPLAASTDRLHRLGVVGIVDLDLHIVDRGVAAEEQLGLFQRHVDKASSNWLMPTLKIPPTM